MKRSIVGATIISIALLGAACSSTTSTPPMPSQGGGGTAGGSTWGSDIRTVVSDLSTVSSTASNAASSGDYSTVANACQTLLNDTETLKSDSPPSQLNGDNLTHYNTAVDKMITGATECVSGANNSDPNLLTQSATDFTAAGQIFTSIASSITG